MLYPLFIMEKTSYSDEEIYQLSQEYSIGRTAETVGLNKRQVCYRIQKHKDKVKSNVLSEVEDDKIDNKRDKERIVDKTIGKGNNKDNNSTTSIKLCDSAMRILDIFREKNGDLDVDVAVNYAVLQILPTKIKLNDAPIDKISQFWKSYRKYEKMVKESTMQSFARRGIERAKKSSDRKIKELEEILE